MKNATEFVQVSTAAPSRELADSIADALVKQRLAACVQIVGPIASTYRWLGAVERADEWLCVIKSSRDRFDAVAAAIRELHPYDIPEIVATPIIAGDAAYLRWIAEQTPEK